MVGKVCATFHIENQIVVGTPLIYHQSDIMIEKLVGITGGCAIHS